MTERRSWKDAERLAAEIVARKSERQILELLARLPLASTFVLAPFIGRRSTLYRALGRLRDLELVDAITPSLRPGHAPRLWYLTDLGLAVVALVRGTAPRDLAQRQRLRGSDLLGLLPGLPQLIALYDLLGALAASGPGRPSLVAWERPWRRRFWRSSTRAPGRVSFPASCALAWREGTGAYLLVPDLGTTPPRAWRTAFAKLAMLRAMQPEAVPLVLIATTDPGRAEVWHCLVDEVARTRREAPLPGHVVLWSDLPTGLGRLPLCSVSFMSLEHRDDQTSRPAVSHSDGLLSHLVGEALNPCLRTARPSDHLGRIAQGLTAADRSFLEVVGRHPFLDPDQISRTSDFQVERGSGRLERLITGGLVRRIGPREGFGFETVRDALELTRLGLAIVAAQQGLSSGSAVHYNGLVGGGPERPFGARFALVRNLAHTRGVDAVFVELARQLARAGENAALIEWRNAAACARRCLRPDGYGIARCRGQLHGFFLEYDRGTMRIPGYLKKFAAYYAYLVSGRFHRDYAGFPTILVVTLDNAAEERISRAARSAAVGRSACLPLLLTCRWRIEHERNPHGLLGPIWRRPEADFDARQSWPLGLCPTFER